MMKDMPAFDYIVVGGGSAGCIVAARLAQARCGTVLLIEAGESAEQNPETLSADGFKYAFANDRVMWDRMSALQKNCGSRSIYMGSGTGMGGSGAVNGMVYTRGDKRDFAQWPPGWQWEDVAPAFAAVEKHLRVRTRPASRFTEIGIGAALAQGFKRKDSLNDGDLAGFIGYNDMNYEGDERRNSYRAFIREQKSQYLTVRTQTIVQRILFDQQRNAFAVEVESNSHKRSIRFNKEVILCAGALETPKLLMLSGIGPKTQLEKFSIPLVMDAPAIGQNLHDHPNVCLFYKGRQKVDFGHPQVYGFYRSNSQSDLPTGQADTCYTFMSAPITLKQSMYRMLPALMLPGKLFFNKTLRTLCRWLVNFLFVIPGVERFVDQIWGFVVILGKPKSRGQLQLASADVRDQALIDPAYYSDPTDMETMLKSVALAKQIAASKGLSEWGNTPLVAANRSDNPDTVRKWIHGATMTTFHYSGTCMMGEGDNAPVDLQLKLKGASGVRIADASVIPEIPVSAINAPSMMIGYRAAEFIVSTMAQETTSNHSFKVANL